ncbi:amino acid permease [Megamonas hypermegale]|uniref:amino acid permease n=1 Tax=Megamonas hypermegale TaxID=158847 RepID=UPI0025A4BCD8|nr:amino acid permease [Megamonas hypermegale]MDM8144221.1 amino acid permease [Megamonas hypermegale]
MDLFRKKDIGALRSMAQKSGLTRNLSAFDLVFLGIGSVIGTGIFVLTGVGAALYAGPGISLSFVLASVACAFAGLAYAEYASMVPVAGSAYTYTYASLGEFMAFIVGWNLVLEYTVTCSTVASGWSGYVVGLLASGGVDLPVAFTKVPEDGGIINLPAIFITMFLCILLVRGTKETVMINRILVFVKLAVIAIFFVIATPHVDPTNWDPFLPFGYQGIASGAAIVFFAYIGFDAVATSAEEAKNPSRDLPIGILGSLFVCAILYFFVALVLTGIVPYTDLNTPEPVAYALRAIGYPIGSAIVAVGAICGITTVLLVLLYGQARIFFALSRDGMIPAGICKIHKLYRTPYLVTIGGCILVAAIAGFAPIHLIAEMANIGTLSAFFLAGFGVLYLRITRPDIKRGFKCPAIYFVSPMAMLSCGYLMYNLPVHTWIRFVIWCGIGLVIYFGYSYKHSKMQSSDK